MANWKRKDSAPIYLDITSRNSFTTFCKV